MTQPHSRLATRRTVLRLLGSAAITAAVGSRVAAGATAAPPIPSWPTELKRLAPRVYAYTQAGGPGINNASISNAGFVVGDRDLLGIDSLGPPILAKKYKAAAVAATGKQFGRVINTHHHRDHSNGNYLFAPAEIVAHDASRELVIEEGIPEHPYPERPEWQEGMSELRLYPATTTVSGNITYYYNDLRVEVLAPGPAHTFGDLMVYIPENRILFTGDIAFFYVTPALFASLTTRWLEVVNRVLDMEVDIIVPGHGPVGGKRELAMMGEFLHLLITESRKSYDLGLTAGQAAAEIDLGPFESWGNRERIPAATSRLYLEFSGKLTPSRDLKAQAVATEEYNAIRTSRGFKD